MQKVLVTIENTKNAYLFLNLINQFDFVHSVEFEKTKFTEAFEEENFTNELSDDFFLNDLQMTVKEFRLQTLQDEKEHGMSKKDFFKSMKTWRQTIEK